MLEIINSFKNSEGIDVYYYIWKSNDIEKDVKGIVQIAHGMAEEASRYKCFAERLVDAGYIVYANDHRAHGKTAKNTDELGLWGENGFEGCVDDLYQLNTMIKQVYKKPIILFGHSMGSFMAQRFIQKYNDAINALILCGSNGKQPSIILNLGLLIAKLEKIIRGENKKSKLLHKLSFGNYNNKFKPVRTEYDWLSRDINQVDIYVNNPCCGTVFPIQFYLSFLKGLKTRTNKNEICKIKKELPILLIAGDKDPVGAFGKGVENLYCMYTEIGVEDIEIKLYKDARHELLNETNRDEVVEDICRWLNRHK